MKRPTILIVTLLLAAGFAAAQTATAPSAASAPSTAAAIDPAADKLLDALELAGKKYDTLVADLDYSVALVTTGESESRTGTVSYKREQGDQSAKFRISFLTLRQEEGAVKKEPVDYAFDGQWFIIAKHTVKQLSRYQVAAPGEKVESMRIGKGPFPLPFGQKKADILKYFVVTTAATKEGDPKDTVYLKLTARPEYDKELSFRTLEMWIDKDRNLPVKIRSVERNKNVTTVVFDKIQTDKKLEDSTFTIPKPPGWEETVERFDQRQKDGKL